MVVICIVCQDGFLKENNDVIFHKTLITNENIKFKTFPFAVVILSSPYRQWLTTLRAHSPADLNQDKNSLVPVPTQIQLLKGRGVYQSLTLGNVFGTANHVNL